MSKVEVIRVLVNQRLTAVAEEIVGLFEKTIAEYQDNLARLVEETERQRRLLDSVVTAGCPSHHTEFQQVLAINDVLPNQQKLGLCLNREYIGANHIKEEQEEMWSSQGGEKLQGVEKFPFSCVPLKSESQEGLVDNSPYILKVLHGDFQQLQGCNQEVPSEEHEWRPVLKQEKPEHSQTQVEQEKLRRIQKRDKLMELQENSVIKFPFTAVPVKSEADEEEAQSTHLHKNTKPSDSQSTEHMETESDSEHCGGAEPLTNLASEKTSDSSDSETEDSDDDWKRMTTKQSHFKVLMDNKVVKSEPIQKLDPAPVSEDKTSNSSDSETEDSDCDLRKSKECQSDLTSVKLKEVSTSSSEIQTENKTYSRQHLKKHTNTHTAQMAFHGSQLFICKANLDKGHMRTNSPERLLSSSKKCKDSASLNAQNTKDKSFICSSCDKSFQRKAHLVLHMKMHKEKSNLSGTDGR